MTPCPGRSADGTFNLNAFDTLQPDGQRLIRRWFDNAVSSLDDPRRESFEPFIYAWIAFNGWADWCSGEDSDRSQNRATAASPELGNKFLELLAIDPSFVDRVGRFRANWPIFSARAIRRLRAEGRLGAPDGNRREVVEHYLAHGIRPYEPECYETHLTLGELIPNDWPHTLMAIYRVRCNLFHGEKTAYSESDVSIVDTAVGVLVPFIKGYIKGDDEEDEDTAW